MKGVLFQHPLIVTIIFTLCTFGTSMMINGLYNVALENIIRRFELSVTYMSSVTACYGLIQCILVVPISYRYGRKYKAKVIGIAMLLYSVGAFCFALPHLLTDVYYPIKESCQVKCEKKLENLKYLFNVAYLLMGAGNVPLFTICLSYIAENNIYNNVKSNYHYAIYYSGTAIGPACGVIIGGLLGNLWVDELDKGSLPPTDIDTQSKLWVGNWWVAYLAGAVWCLLLGIIVILFVPEDLVFSESCKKVFDQLSANESLNMNVSLKSVLKTPEGSLENGLLNNLNLDRRNSLALSEPGSSRRGSVGSRKHGKRRVSFGVTLKEKPNSNRTLISRDEFKTSQRSLPSLEVKGEGRDWAELVPSYKKLCANVAFIGLTIACAMDLGFTSIMSIYGIQLLSELYSISPYYSSLIFSGSLATIFIALPLSSHILTKWDLRTKKGVSASITFMRWMGALAGLTMVAFYMPCDSTHYYTMAGDINYSQIQGNITWNTSDSYTNWFNNKELYGTCSSDLNGKCDCGTDDYVPVCAAFPDKKVTFFHPCHVGCTMTKRFERAIENVEDYAKQYKLTDCQCVDDSIISFGTCSKYNCDHRITFIIFCLVVSCFVTSMVVVPVMTTSQAVVPDHLRTAGLGMQAFIYRAFGSIPVPIITAGIIDQNCLWWGTTCSTNRGACRAFDKEGLQISTTTIMITLKLLAVLSLSVSLRYVNTVEVLRDNDYEESGSSEDPKHKMRTSIIISETSSERSSGEIK